MRFGPPTPVESGIMLLGCGSSGSSITYTPPLDAVSSSVLAAFGFTRLFSGVTDGARVRRSSDSSEQEVETFATGEFDSAGFTSFVGGGSGYARYWRDQKGTLDVGYSTASKQAQVVLSGINSKPVLQFDGTDDLLTNTSVPNSIGTGDFEFWCVLNPSSLTGYRCLGSLEPVKPVFYASAAGNAKFTFFDGVSFRAFNTTVTTSTSYLVRFFRVSGTMYCAVNGTTEATSWAYTASIAASSAGMALSSESVASQGSYFSGQIACALWFGAGLDNGAAATLTTHLKTYYGIA